MEKTVGTTDKVIRIIIGIILLLIAIAFPVGTAWTIILVILGLIALITGISGFCPLYSLLGINTCKTKTADT